MQYVHGFVDVDVKRQVQHYTLIALNFCWFHSGRMRCFPIVYAVPFTVISQAIYHSPVLPCIVSANEYWLNIIMSDELIPLKLYEVPRTAGVRFHTKYNNILCGWCMSVCVMRSICVCLGASFVCHCHIVFVVNNALYQFETFRLAYHSHANLCRYLELFCTCVFPTRRRINATKWSNN